MELLHASRVGVHGLMPDELKRHTPTFRNPDTVRSGQIVGYYALAKRDENKLCHDFCDINV